MTRALPRWLRANALWAISALAVALFVSMQIRLLDYRIWNDEAETVVGAKMMVAGGRLYQTIFDQHGPMTFFTGFIVESLTNGTIATHRIVIALLQWAMIVAILRSPTLSGRARLVLFLCITAALTGPLRELFAHMYKYQVQCGIAVASAIALHILPQMRRERPRAAAAAAAGFCIGVIPFFSFIYLPAAICLSAAGITRATWKAYACGLVIGIALSLGFLGIFGSFKGYYAYHYYVSTALNAAFSPTIPSMLLSWLHYPNRPLALAAAILIAAAVWKLWRVERVAPWRIALLMAAIASFMIRGNIFYALPFYYSLMPLLLLFADDIERIFARLPILGCALVAALLVQLSGLLPWDVAALRKRPIDYHTAFALVVDAYTQPQDRVVSFSFDNFDYLAADRLPATTHFFFMPWQQTYNDHPVLGMRADVCEEISTRRPKFVRLDRWTGLDRYHWSDFAGCLDRLMASDYRLLPGTVIYARKDIAVAPEIIAEAAALPK